MLEVGMGLLLASLIVGYWLGRTRPYEVLANKAWWRTFHPAPGAPRWVFWAYVWAVLNPGKFLRAWRQTRKQAEARTEVGDERV